VDANGLRGYYLIAKGYVELMITAALLMRYSNMGCRSNIVRIWGCKLTNIDPILITIFCSLFQHKLNAHGTLALLIESTHPYRNGVDDMAGRDVAGSLSTK
jgi:hypothetical protein